MLANVEANLRNEMGGKSGYLVALPDALPKEQADVVKQGMASCQRRNVHNRNHNGGLWAGQRRRP